MKSREGDMIEYYKNHVMKEDDRFAFECKKCGKCCQRSGDEPIILTGVDIAKIARHLGKTCQEVLQEYCNANIGPQTGLPVATLAMNRNGKCRLLKGGRCSVQANKPVACAVYPLGRMVTMAADGTPVETVKFEYFTQPASGCPGEKTGTTHSLKEWKERFGLSESEQEVAEWNLMVAPASKIAKAVMNDPAMKVENEMAAMIFLADQLYEFDPEADLLEQLKEHRKRIDKSAGLIDQIASLETMLSGNGRPEKKGDA